MLLDVQVLNMQQWINWNRLLLNWLPDHRLASLFGPFISVAVLSCSHTYWYVQYMYKSTLYASWVLQTYGNLLVWRGGGKFLAHYASFLATLINLISFDMNSMTDFENVFSPFNPLLKQLEIIYWNHQSVWIYTAICNNTMKWWFPRWRF